jgi:hypothetical protein
MSIVDRENHVGNTLSREFIIHLMEFFSAMGGVVALYYLEHPTDFRIGMTRIARSASKFCQNQSVFWIRTSNGFLDMSDRFKP